MARAFNDRGGDPGGTGRKRGRRRAPTVAAGDLTEAVEANGSGHPQALRLGVASAAVAVLAPPEPEVAGSNGGPLEVPVPDVYKQREASVEAGPHPAPTVLQAAPDKPHDEFGDLLGQAVGLRLDSVSREFGGDNEMRVTALRDVSIDIGPGEFVAVVGPSGCGKSTLLSLMGGLDRPSSGHVYAAGLPLGELSDGDLANYRLQRVGTIFQSFNLVPSMSVEDNVALPPTLAGVGLEERRRRARHLLDLVGLTAHARLRASRLSGGEQQKVAVARALASRPGLILADEPTGSLDSAAGEVILNLLDVLNRRGATVVLVTHDPEVARHARRVIRMIDGRAIELDPGTQTVRRQDPIDPPTRLHWRDTLKVGLGSAGRRPLRTSLTTGGVAIGIAAMSLIVALAGGLQAALSTPALATSQMHQVQVASTAGVNGALDGGTLAMLGGLTHVRAAWGEIAMSGTFNAGSTPASAAPGGLVSLPPLSESSGAVGLMAGRLPSSDTAGEVLLTESEARALGFPSAAAAVGKSVQFSAANGTVALLAAAGNPVTHQVLLPMTVVGIVSSQSMPAGVPGGLVPYSFARAYWTKLAQVNGWKKGEYANVTLLADSGPATDSLRSRVESLGFPAQTFGDQFRGFESLLVRLRLALLSLALVAVLLACLGIANTMYTAVLERTKEIGVLKALGARRRDVLLLFVAEAAVIGLAGGLLGIILAVGLARLGNVAVDRLTEGVTRGGLAVFQLDIAVLTAALGLAVLLSTVGGLLPAVRAARQDVIKALRYE